MQSKVPHMLFNQPFKQTFNQNSINTHFSIPDSSYALLGDFNKNVSKWL